jgi:uncharacterized protein YlxW (UPF0749 family)
LGLALAIACSALAVPAGAANDEVTRARRPIDQCEVPVPSGSQADRTRATIQAFADAAAALERGDRATAAQHLDGMSTAVASLRATAVEYNGFARQMQANCANRRVEAMNQVQEAYHQAQEEEGKLGELQARLRGLNERSQSTRSMLERLGREMRPVIEEINFANKCESDVGFAITTPKCYELAFKQAFTNHYDRLNNDMRHFAELRDSLLQDRERLNEELRRTQNEADSARRRVHELNALVPHLERLGDAAGYAMTTLSDIEMFWSDADTILQGRVSGDIRRLHNVVRRLDRPTSAPLFDDFDKDRVRSLRARMLDFAQSVDSGKNVLSKNLACQ